MVRVEATTAPATSRSPSETASSRPFPPSRCRSTFSSTTIALSTTMPIASDSAIRLMMLSDWPAKCRTAKTTIIEDGMARATTTEERMRRRNKKTTTTTNTPPHRTASVSAWTIRRTNSEASETTETCSPCGSFGLSRSTSACTRRATSTTFAPLRFRTTISCAGRPSNCDKAWRSAGPTETCATSRKRTTPPVFEAPTTSARRSSRLANSAGSRTP